jgi:hypothetical protein
MSRTTRKPSPRPTVPDLSVEAGRRFRLLSQSLSSGGMPRMELEMESVCGAPTHDSPRQRGVRLPGDAPAKAGLRRHDD